MDWGARREALQRGHFHAATLIVVPPLMVFLILQRYFVRGISMTGIKG